jgi:hypothetical protein
MAQERGTLGIFGSPSALKAAAAKARAAGFTKCEAFSPFPIHGIEKALGIKNSWISKVTLLMGLAGAGLFYYFQVWTSSVDWPINVGGKPMVSWPAFIPITFEGMILIGGISTVAALVFACRLPNYRQRIFDPRLTEGKFGLFIDRRDPQYNQAEVDTMLQGAGAEELMHVE